MPMTIPLAPSSFYFSCWNSSVIIPKNWSNLSFNPAINFWWPLVSVAQSPNAFTQRLKPSAIVEGHQPFSSTQPQTLCVSSGHSRTMYLNAGCASESPMELSQIQMPGPCSRDSDSVGPRCALPLNKASQMILTYSCTKLPTHGMWTRL